jgi:cell division protease FtsH
MSTPQPAAPAPELAGRPRDEDILTRRRMPAWDHLKWLILLAAIWLLLVFSLMGDNPLVGFEDACRLEVQMGWWVFVLAGLELLHQLHFVISERSHRYHQFWLHQVWNRTEKFKSRYFSPWVQFRFWRLVRWAVVIVVIAIFSGKIIHVEPALALLKLPALLWHALPYILQIAVSLLFVVAEFALLFWFLSRGGVDVYYPDDVKTRFSDVWGQDHVLERVRENILFLESPELVEDHGGYVPGGILLWGPPGTGKTLMAEAVAGETGKPYVFVEPAALTSNMFFGIGVLKVKSLFRKLRRLSLRYGGVIVFLDEADALGNRGLAVSGGVSGRMAPFAAAGCHGFSYLSPDVQWILARDAVRGVAAEQGRHRDRQILPGFGGMRGGGSGGFDGTLQALLAEMSGLKKPRGFINRQVRKALGMRPKPPPKYRILMMMASNMPDSLDPAFLRPGRIDRIYKVGYPSKAGRIRTYQGYFAKVPHEVTDEQIDKLATITPYATGATIKDLVNEALINAVRDGRDVITWQDVIRAKQLKQLGPPEDVEYIERERHAVAVHEACHAVVAYRTRRHLEIDIATIEKGSDYLGMVSSIKPEDQFTRWRSEFESDILVSLASLAGERLFFEKDSSSGVSGDLMSATTVASMMEGFWGMGTTVSSMSATQSLQVGMPGQRGRGQGEDPMEQARRALADKIEDNLARLLAKAESLLRENEGHILALAHALEVHKTLSGEDVSAVLEGQCGTVVDGTPYADDEFIRELREYHLAAVRAHHDHDRPRIPLPAPAQDLVAAAADGYGLHPYTGSGGTGPTGNGLLSGSHSPASDIAGSGPDIAESGLDTVGSDLHTVGCDLHTVGCDTGSGELDAGGVGSGGLEEPPPPTRRSLSLSWPPGSGQRVRRVVNLVNGSTLAGLAVARAGGAFAGGGTLIRGPEGLLTATGYRLPVPASYAFTLGNVIIVTRRWPGAVPLEDSAPQIFAHEARHATQYAWCGLLLLPLYLLAAAASWALCGSFSAWNVFERQAVLADGGYADRPVRPGIARLLTLARRPRSR